MAFNSLSDLRKSSKSFENLMKEVEKVANPQQSNSSDDRFWQPEADKAGNGYAVIRFLPAPQGEDLPWVQIWNHGFQGPTGKWYIENSLTSIGKPDPVSEYNSILWNSGSEADKEIARKQKRRLTYIANILVVKDPTNPQNEGKVFLFKFGKKIFEKIKDIMKPQFEDEDPINPFDPWAGANFKVKIRKVEGYRNYDKSEFETISAISEDDSEIEDIWKKQHSLQAFLAPENFKSYEELKRKLDMVLASPAMAQAKAEHVDLDPDDVVVATKPTAVAAKAKPKDEEDDDLSYFASLAED